MKKNALKEKISSGDVAVGSFLFAPSPTVMEIFGYAGFDFVIIDAEHAPTGALDTVNLENIVRAGEVSGTTPLVRIPERSRVMTQKVLDAGALGVVVPMIQTRREAEEAVLDAKYPPLGHRGSCYLTRPTQFTAAFTQDYWAEANKNTMVIPLIESKMAVDNLEDILSVDGIDFLFFGARDYSMSLGYPTTENPETKRAIEHVNEVCERRGVPLARFLYPPYDRSVKQAIDEGFRILVVGGDVALLYQACRDVMKSVGR